MGEATKSDNMETLKSVNKHFISAMASSIAKIINKLVSELYDLRIYGKKLYNYLYNIKDNIVAKVITGML